MPRICLHQISASFRSGFKILLVAHATTFLYFTFLESRSIGQTATFLKAMETRVWNDSDDNLLELKQKIVKHLQKNPHSEMGHYLLSHLYLRIFLSSEQPQSIEALNYLRDALELAQQALLLNSNSSVGYVALADILEVMGDSERAANTLKTIPQTGDHKEWRVLFSHIRSTADKKLPQQIFDELVSLLQQHGTNREIVGPFMVQLLDTAFSPSAATEKILLLRQKGLSTTAINMYLGQIYTDNGQIRKSAQIYQSILMLNPDLAEAQINLAILEYSVFKKPSQAIKRLHNVLHLEEISPKNSTLSRLHLAAAYLHLGGHEQKAEDNILKILLPEEENLDFFISFAANQYITSKSYKPLTNLLHDLTSQLPGEKIVFEILGDIYQNYLGKPNEAVNAYKNATVLDPTNTAIINAMGLSYYSLGNFTEAMLQFDHILLLNPDHATATYNKACMLALQGRSDESMIVLIQAINLDPSLRQTAKSDDDLINLHSNPDFRQIVFESPELSQK